MNILTHIFKRRPSTWLLACLALLSLPVLAGPTNDLDAASGRYFSFDDYSLTNDVPPTWRHFGGLPSGGAAAGLLAGSNHVHKSNWSFMHCRLGRNTASTNNILPILNGNPYVPNGTNYCLYLQNRLEVLIHSPVFTTGAGSLYMDTISLNASDIHLSIYIATNMLDSFSALVPIDASANSNRQNIVWEALPIDTIALISGAPKIPYKKQLNIRQPVCIKIVRDDIFASIARDNYYAVIDNLRVSPPPADVILEGGYSPFNGYPSVNNDLNLQLKIDNAPGPYTSAAAQRTNVLFISRWNYVGQRITPWTTNAMTCVDAGDGLGNNELWRLLTPPALPRYSDVADLEYYFICQFNGTYYQSKDYTTNPPVLNVGLFPPENKSPRTYSKDGLTQGSGTNNPFVFQLRLFPSSHDTVKTVLFVNGSTTPIEIPMSLSNTNRWQGKYNVIDNAGVTNLLWYYEAVGAFTNIYGATPEKVFWQNTSISHIQNGTLPYGDNCGMTDISITNRPVDWFGVNVTPGESSYVLFTLDTGRTNYIAGRGEYQNFNDWVLGAGTENYFTDSDDKHPKSSYSQTFSNGWQQSQFSGMSNYFIGITTNYTTAETSALRVGPENILNYATDWAAGSFQYVVERTPGNTSPDYVGTAGQRRNQGIRLFGGDAPFSLGYLQGNQTTRSQGIGTLSFKARVSRPLPLNKLDYSVNAAWRMTDMLRTNFVLRTSMNATSMSPETPSMSLIAYYQNMLKFYEYRLTQTPDSRDLLGGTAFTNIDACVTHELWRWDGTLTPKLIASCASTNRAKLTGNFATYPTEFHVYNPSPTETRLKVKFSQENISSWINLAAGVTVTSNIVIDTSATRPKYGSYGFHSADCEINANIMQIADLSSTGTLISAYSSIIGTPDEWFLAPGVYTTSFASETPLTTVNVLTGKPETGSWTPIQSNTVTGYSFQNFSATIKAWYDLCARIQVANTDSIVLDGVSIDTWHARPTIESYPTPNGWLITEGWISSNATDKTFVHLDASQAAVAPLIQGVQSTRLMGIGSILFDYRVTAAPAKLKLQYTADAFPSDFSNDGWNDITNFIFSATNGWVTVNLFFGMAAETNLNVRFVNDTTYSSNSIIDLRNITIWDNPTNSPSDWAAYNMKITATDTNKWWIDKSRSGYLNNSTNLNIYPGRPMDLFNPYIMAPRLTRGLGTISFLARAFTTNYVAGPATTSISIYATKDPWDRYKPDALWTNLATFSNITNAFYRPFFYSHPDLPNDFQAVKLVVKDVIPLAGVPRQVCIDEIVVTEAIYPRFDITNVKLLVPTAPSPTETKQPLEGDDLGVEAQLTNILLDPKNIEVSVTYVLGTNTWGVFNAPGTNQFTKKLDLVDAATSTYRITGDFMTKGIPEQEKYTVVQYLVWAEYNRENSTNKYLITQVRADDKPDRFVNPSWYKPVDLNRVGHLETGVYKSTWSPYYIVYDVPPGSVWINELNLNEDNAILTEKVFMNPYIEVAQPAWMSLKGWTVEILDQDHLTRLTKTLDSNTVVAPADASGYGLFVIGPFDFEATSAIPPYPPLSTTTVVHQAVQQIQGGYGSPSLYPGGYRLKRPMGMYEQAIVYDWDPVVFLPWNTGIDFITVDPSFSYVGREYYNGSLSFTGAVTVVAGRYDRLDSTNSWEQGVSTLHWTPGKRNIGQAFPNCPMPGGSNVLIISTLLSPDGLTHGWQNNTRQNPLLFKMKKGQGTNFVYTAEPWFRIYGVVSNNVLVFSPAPPTTITNYVLTLSDVQTNINLVTDLRLAPHVINEVTTADMIAWIQQFGDRPLVPTYYGAGTNTQLRLLEEYWLDMDPTQTNRLIFSQKAVTPDTNGLWLTLEMATVNGSSQTNRITFLRGDAMVAAWVKDVFGSILPWRILGQYWISPNSFDTNYLARTRINGYTNDTAWFKWTLDHNDQRIATNELINVPAP